MNNIIYLIIIILILLLLIINKIHRNKSVNFKIPGPWKRNIPIIGNYYECWTSKIIPFQKWYEQYGPIFFIKLGTVDTVVLTSAEIINEAFVKNGSDFEKRYQRRSRLKSMNAESVIYSNNDLHNILRKTVSSETTSTKIKKLDYHFTEEIKRLCLLLDKFAIEEKPIIINNYLFLFSFNIMIRLIFGEEYTYSNLEEAKDFIDAIDKLFLSLASSIRSDYLPFLDYFDHEDYFKKFPYLKTFIVEIIAKYDKNNENVECNDDYTTIIGGLRYAKKQGKITEFQIENTILELIGSGTQNPGRTNIHGIYAITNSIEIQSKLYESIKSTILPQQDDKQIENNECCLPPPIILNRIKYAFKIPYLNMFIKETYRKYTALPAGIPHITSKDTIIHGYKIAKGTQVFQSIYATHRDPSVYKQPNTFIPERFEDSSLPDPIGFGAGVRNCFGKEITENQMFTLFATLCNRYEFSNFNPSEKYSYDFINNRSLGLPSDQIIIKIR